MSGINLSGGVGIALYISHTRDGRPLSEACLTGRRSSRKIILPGEMRYAILEKVPSAF